MTKKGNTTWMVTGVLGVAGVVAAVLATSPSGASPAPGEVIVVTPGPQVTVEQTDDGAGRPAEDVTSGGGRDGGSASDERTSGGSSGSDRTSGSGGSGSGSGSSGSGSGGSGGSGSGGSGSTGSGSTSGGGGSDDDAPETVSMASPVSADSAPSAQSADD